MQMPASANTNDKALIDAIYRICTPNSAAIIVDEYRKSNKSTYLVEKSLTNEIHLKTPHNTYIVRNSDTNVPTCNCTEAVNYMIPCRHVFYCKRITEAEVVMEDLVPARWRNKSYETEEEIVNYHTDQTTSIVVMPSIYKSIPKTSTSRYNTSLRQTQELAQLISKTPSDYFDRQQTISMLIQFWNSDIKVKLVPVDTQSLQRASNSDVTLEVSTAQQLETQEPEPVSQEVESSVQTTETEVQQATPAIPPGTQFAKTQRRGRPTGSKNKKQRPMTSQHIEQPKHSPSTSSIDQAQPQVPSKKRKPTQQTLASQTGMRTTRQSKRQKTNEENIRAALSMFVCEAGIVEQILNGDLLLEERHVRYQPELISLIPDFDVNILKPFCDCDAFKAVASVYVCTMQENFDKF
jgi:hypothetical protein